MKCPWRSRLDKYVDEVVSFWLLILALHARPHSSQWAVTESRQQINAIFTNDVSRALELMAAHLGSVEQRAIIAGASATKLDLCDVIQKYARQIESANEPAFTDTMNVSYSRKLSRIIESRQVL